MRSPGTLEELDQLDRSLIHLFVAGPGYGEAVAVALPERGWLLVDGCSVDDDGLPLRSILDRWRGESGDDPVDCLALTHPHKDHAIGFRAILESTMPTRVTLAAPPERPLDGTVLAGHPENAPTTSDGLRRRAVADACAAIRRYHSAHPERVIGVEQGTPIPVSSPSVAVTVRSPRAEVISDAIAAVSDGKSIPDPNAISTVFEIEFGDTRLVLGSDLVSQGWSAALDVRPELGAHHGLKVPHHGSRTAHHDGLMTTAPDRAWIVAPFSPSRLPVHADGLPWLVSRCNRLHLTAAPLARSRQPFPPGEVPITDLNALFAAGAPPGHGAVVVSPPRDLQPLDAVWVVAFDRSGEIQGMWRGPRAFSVVDSA